MTKTSKPKLKTCTICASELPATKDYFYGHKYRADGLNNECKACDDEKRKRNRKNRNDENSQIHGILEGRVDEHVLMHDIKRARVAAGVVARNEIFLKGLEDLMAKNPLPPAVPYKGKKAVKTARILNLMLSDLHYGSDLITDEAGFQYGVTEEARRTAAVVKAAADWKRQYRDETVLYVHLIGDIIQGKLHDPEAGAPLAEQFQRSIWNLGQALRFLASEFKEVKVFTAPGNHGRRKDRHPDRAVNQKWDGIENMIYASLKMSLEKACPNVTVEIPLKPYYVYEAFDQRGFMTHGDTVLNVGFPNKLINVESVRKQINEINNVEKAQLFGVGHVHVASSTRLPNNVVLITNGCLVPSDEYAQSIGIMSTACCQQIWESVPGIIIGHRMEILVDEKTDKDSSLDDIVKPYPGPAEFGKASNARKSR